MTASTSVSHGGRSFVGLGGNSNDRTGVDSRVGSERSQEFRHAPVIKSSTQKTQSYKHSSLQVDRVDGADPQSVKSSSNKDTKNRGSIFNP